MIHPLIHYEVEMTTRQQERLQRQAALWQLARQAATDEDRLAQPRWLHICLAVVALIVASIASANPANRG